MGQSLSAAAVSLTVAGNEGIAPFLTLFLLGIIEKSNPTLLNIEPAMEGIISSWFGLVVLGILTLLEFVAKCVPVIDSLVDSAMTFIVPVMSIAGTFSTLGLYGSNDDDVDGADGAQRKLSIAAGALIVFKIFIVVVGVGFSLGMHFFKMIVRLVGEGWLTNCLAVLEVMFCCVTVTMAVFIREIAIFVACCMGVAVLFTIKHKVYDPWKAKKDAEKEEAASAILAEDDLEGKYEALASNVAPAGGQPADAQKGS